VTEEKPPSLGKWSDRPQAPDATHTVTRDTEYKLLSDPDQVVDKEQRVKAYQVPAGASCALRPLLLCIVLEGSGGTPAQHRQKAASMLCTYYLSLVTRVPFASCLAVWLLTGTVGHVTRISYHMCTWWSGTRDGLWWLRSTARRRCRSRTTWSGCWPSSPPRACSCWAS
jgi:hypothetical protein